MGRRALLALLAATLLAACSEPGAAPRGASRVPSPAPYRHMILVVMENLSYASALRTPGLAALTRRFAYDPDAYAVSHPSLPNYLALVAGSTFGITTDCTSCYVAADNLGAQLSAAHRSWGDFSESVPHRCFLGPYAGEYAGKHNPFRYFRDVRDTPGLCAHLVGLAPLLADLRGPASSLPSLSFVTPNLCDDGHDCAAQVAAGWLTGFLRKVTSSAAWSDRTLVVVTWDESYDDDTEAVTPDGAVTPTGGGGHVLVLLCARGIRRGARIATPLNQVGILAFVEHNFALPLLAGARRWRGHLLALP